MANAPQPPAPGQPAPKKNAFLVSDFSVPQAKPKPPAPIPPAKPTAPAAPPAEAAPTLIERPVANTQLPTIVERPAAHTQIPTIVERPGQPAQPGLPGPGAEAKTIVDAPQPTMRETMRLPDGAATLPAFSAPPKAKPKGTFVFTMDTPPARTAHNESALPTQALPSGAGNSFATGAVTHLSKAPVAPTLDTQDLISEKLLMAAPRGKYGPREVPTLGGIYLLAKLGQGGMGAVYYGIHPHLNKEVAVKVLPFHLAERDPDLVARFFREAQIAAKIRSPHLVSVTDACEEQGLCYLVMEYVAGGTANGYLKTTAGKGLAETEALDICIASARGLEAAHQQGVIHRDIKPDNILIPKVKNVWILGQAKLADLGLARFEEHGQSLTGSQSTMGTPGYMSPEQAMDARTAGKPADIFSFGATLYGLLCGRPPFHGKIAMDIIMNTVKEPHEPAVSLRPEISPATNMFLDRCLAKEPHVRFKDATELLAALAKCKDAIGKPGKEQRKLVEELRGPLKQAALATPAPGAATLPAGPGYREPQTVEEATLMLQPRFAPARQQGFPLVATIVLSLSIGAGFTLWLSSPDEPEKPPQTAAVPDKPAKPAKPPELTPSPEPAVHPLSQPTPAGRLSAEEQQKDTNAELIKRFDKVNAWVEKAEVVKTIQPVSSVGIAAEEASSSSLSASRMVLGFLLSTLGFAYMLYGRKAGSLAFGICGALMMICTWVLSTLPLIVLAGGILASVPLFLVRK